MATSPRIADSVGVSQLHIEQVEDLLKLQKAAQKITSILDLDQLIDKVVTDIARSFGCLEAQIYLHEEERGELVHRGMLRLQRPRQRAAAQGRQGRHGWLRGRAPARCATLPTCARISITSPARRPRFRR